MLFYLPQNVAKFCRLIDSLHVQMASFKWEYLQDFLPSSAVAEKSPTVCPTELELRNCHYDK